MNLIETNKPLKELTTNDWVILYRRRYAELYQISRTTPTLIIIKIDNLAGQLYERKFRKDDGYEVGQYSYGTPYIKPYSHELWEREQQEKRYHKVHEKLPSINESEIEKVNRVYNYLLSENLITPID